MGHAVGLPRGATSLSPVAATGFIPLWVWVARGLDTRRNFILGTVSWIVVLLRIAALRANHVTLAYALPALSGCGRGIERCVRRWRGTADE